ncbi:MAG: hypothetical protein U1D35_04570 [Paracoccaceae bacterium]|nr:hypothetical protein [Paracoccaceae bacterium]
MSLDTQLAAQLAALAARGQTITYGDLARALAVPGPGSIARLTAALESLMAQDAEVGHPFRAALCRARLGDLPAPGFFAAARALGRYDGPDAGPEAMNFVQAERAALRGL